MNRQVLDPALRTWVALNAAMRICTEEYALKLLHLERTGRRRKQFLLRIHSRINFIRAQRERLELKKVSRTRT